MADDNNLLRPEELAALQQLAQQSDIDGQRAVAVIALDAGATQAEAAEASGLTVNQVRYIVGKFRTERLLAFPESLAFLPAESPETTEAVEIDEGEGQLNHLLDEIDVLVGALKATLPEAGQYPYSPVKMLVLVRDSAARFTPNVQIGLLEPFENMTREDLVDPETWKGIAYMIAYSAQFQANQARGALNDRLPEPVNPDSFSKNVRGGLDRITPDIARDMLANLEGASREDLLDPETWKGMAYMLAYSAQFQAGQVTGKLDEQLPNPLKPDTIVSWLKGGYDKLAPEAVRQILASFEGATREDMMDPETWKGVWYLLNYSLEFQAEQLKQRLNGESRIQDEEE